MQPKFTNVFASEEIKCMKTTQTPATAENEKWHQSVFSLIFDSGVKRNFWLAKVLTSRHVHMHRVIFYIQNTLKKMMV